MLLRIVNSSPEGLSLQVRGGSPKILTAQTHTEIGIGVHKSNDPALIDDEHRGDGQRVQLRACGLLKIKPVFQFLRIDLVIDMKGDMESLGGLKGRVREQGVV